MKITENYIQTLIQALKDDYPYKLMSAVVREGERIFIVVENPDFKEDDGSDLNLAISVSVER